MKTATLIIVLSCISIGMVGATSCTNQSPPELELATVLIAQAGESIEADYQAEIARSAAEVEDKCLEILKRDAQAMAASHTDSRGTLALEDVNALLDFVREQQSEIHTRTKNKIDGAKQAENIRILKELSGELGDYLRKQREGTDALRRIVSTLLPAKKAVVK